MEISNISQNRIPFKKFISLFSVVRGYNILTIVCAQYLAAIFIFAPQHSLKKTLLDKDLLLIVLATICTVAAGYIINNFYDVKKDQINKPIKSKIDSLVTQKTKLKIYFTLNLIGFIFGTLISWKAALFFAIYIFLIWFYSHKLRRQPMLKLISATVLSILPFFVIFIFYQNFSKLIFVHGVFLFLILMIRELIKDLQSITGDIATEYITVPIKYGEPFTKKLVALGVMLTLIPIVILLSYPAIGYMRYYFYFVIIVLCAFIVLLINSNSVKNYHLLHNILKLIILAGVMSLALIDTSVIIKRII